MLPYLKFSTAATNSEIRKSRANMSRLISVSSSPHSSKGSWSLVSVISVAIIFLLNWPSEYFRCQATKHNKKQLQKQENKKNYLEENLAIQKIHFNNVSRSGVHRYKIRTSYTLMIATPLRVTMPVRCCNQLRKQSTKCQVKPIVLPCISVWNRAALSCNGFFLEDRANGCFVDT